MTEPFSISAQNLGPISSFTGELSKERRNIIFARNGTGKSFISRAVRLAAGIADASKSSELISEESGDNRGSLEIKKGTEIALSVFIDGNSNGCQTQIGNYIFHTFSEDFIHEELRERKFTIDGDIKNEIILDVDNIKMDDAKNAVDIAQREYDEYRKNLEKLFDEKKHKDLAKTFKIKKNLREYVNLKFDRICEEFASTNKIKTSDFSTVKKELDSLKSLPSTEISLLETPFTIKIEKFLRESQSYLYQITSPASIAADIKEKIDRKHRLIEEGLQILDAQGLQTCPFCEQDIDGDETSRLIQSYIKYFQDEENRHKRKLEALVLEAHAISDSLNQLFPFYASLELNFEKAKSFLPSQRHKTLWPIDEKISKILKLVETLNLSFSEKIDDLSRPIEFNPSELNEMIEDLSKSIEYNNDQAKILRTAIENFDEERIQIHRRLCAEWEKKFVLEHSVQLQTLSDHRHNFILKQKLYFELEAENPPSKARDLVAKTFVMMLQFIFGGKYTFDEENFVLKRGHNLMVRGPNRTLSDGEKTAIAFCYFIASIHKRVKSASDYQRIFFVVDDPVNSMSYEYIYSLTQTFRYLSLGSHGQISIASGNIEKPEYQFPNILILTHSTYFFNICIANNVVKKHAAFTLSIGNHGHVIETFREYMAPFQEQLRDVVRVADGNSPGVGIGNAIRSVLEAVGRFCYPDKFNDFSQFLQFVSREFEIDMPSILINTLSHGTFHEETPDPEEIKRACMEAVTIIERLAPGQLTLARRQNRV